MRKSGLIIVLLFCLALVGCQGENKEVTESGEKKSFYLEDLAQYQGSYIGDNSAVGAILNSLWGSDCSDGFALKTDEEPYRVVAKYKVDEQQNQEVWSKVDLETRFEDNAIVLFALITNVDEIVIDVKGDVEKEYSYSRVELEKKYDVDFRQLPQDLAAWEHILEQ